MHGVVGAERRGRWGAVGKVILARAARVQEAKHSKTATLVVVFRLLILAREHGRIRVFACALELLCM